MLASYTAYCIIYYLIYDFSMIIMLEMYIPFVDSTFIIHALLYNILVVAASWVIPVALLAKVDCAQCLPILGVAVVLVVQTIWMYQPAIAQNKRAQLSLFFMPLVATLIAHGSIRSLDNYVSAVRKHEHDASIIEKRLFVDQI